MPINKQNFENRVLYFIMLPSWTLYNSILTPIAFYFYYHMQLTKINVIHFWKPDCVKFSLHYILTRFKNVFLHYAPQIDPVLNDVSEVQSMENSILLKITVTVTGTL